MRNELSEMGNEHRMFLLSLCKEVMFKISEVQTLLKHFQFYAEIERLKVFLSMFMIFYKLVTNTTLLYRNKKIEEEIDIGINHHKTITQVYYENHLISTEILNLEK